jgi:hypothetical protein
MEWFGCCADWRPLQLLVMVCRGANGRRRCKAVDNSRFEIGGQSLAGHCRDGRFILHTKEQNRDFNRSSLVMYAVYHTPFIFSETRTVEGLPS